MRTWQYNFLAYLAHLVIKVFFKDLKIIGQENIPEDGPVVVVMNHTNALVDGIVLMPYFQRPIRFLGKSTLWNFPILRTFLNMGMCVRVYRRQDFSDQPDSVQNDHMFIQCYGILGKSGLIALFPEGVSHSKPKMQPLKTGVARIILGTEKYFPHQKITVLPIGLTYDAKAKFRSQVLIKIGTPFVPTEGITEEADPSNQERVRAITHEIQDRLQQLTLNYPSWQEAQLIEEAAALYKQNQPITSTTKGGLADDFEKRKLFSKGYAQLKARYPEKIHEVADALKEYQYSLKALALPRRYDAYSSSRSMMLVYVLRIIVLLGCRLPFAMLGALLNILPQQLVQFLEVKVSKDEEDVVSSALILLGVILYPVFWLLEALVAAYYYGALMGVLIFILAPVSGAYSIFVWERRQALYEEVRTYVILKVYKHAVEELEQRKQTVLKHMKELSELYQTTRDQK